MIVTIESSCPACEEMITVPVLHEPEQRGGMEVEYLPEYMEIEDDSPCECGHVLTRLEEERILNILKRSL